MLVKTGVALQDSLLLQWHTKGPGKPRLVCPCTGLSVSDDSSPGTATDGHASNVTVAALALASLQAITKTGLLHKERESERNLSVSCALFVVANTGMGSEAVQSEGL